jgi:hypothetical protein
MVISRKNNKMEKLPKNVDNYLSMRYYDATKPAAFTSVYKLYKTIQNEGVYNISYNRIKKWAMSQDLMTVNKHPPHRGRMRRPVVTGLMNSVWDTDLLVLNQQRFKNANDENGYLLICVDILSRRAYVAAIKTKTGKDVQAGFQSILDNNAVKPLSIRCDNGREYNNIHVKKFMEKKNINLYFSFSSSKANYAEVFIRTFKRSLFAYFQHNHSYRYIEDLQKLVASYNNSFHSSLKMTPAQVNTENQQDVWFRKYFPPGAYKSAFKVASKMLRSRNVSKLKQTDAFKYSVGDTVRISHLRGKFTRDYDQTYSSEVYRIIKRRILQGIPIYYLQDYNEELLKGGFYEFELQKISFNPNQIFNIEKVIKTRVRKGVKESFVKFENWPSKYNMWLKTSTIKDLI